MFLAFWYRTIEVYASLVNQQLTVLKDFIINYFCFIIFTVKKKIASGEVKSDVSGHITFIANHMSKLDRNERYPTIILKSDIKYACDEID